MKKVVLVDREGTLLVDPLNGRVDSLDKVKLLPSVSEGLVALAQSGYKIIIITNQTNIAQGRITEGEFWQINQKAVQLIEQSGIEVLKTYVCPHAADEGCNCRKPATLLLEQALQDFGLDRETTFIIGDRDSDVVAGKGAGIQSILVLTGKHDVNVDALHPSKVVNNFVDAANYILTMSKN